MRRVYEDRADAERLGAGREWTCSVASARVRAAREWPTWRHPGDEPVGS